MNVLYISTYINDETFNYYNDLTHQNTGSSIAAVKFSYLIKKGFLKNEDVSLNCLYTPSIGNFFLNNIFFYKPIIKEKSSWEKYLCCINIPLLKQLHLIILITFYTLKWYINTFYKKDKYIITSSIQLPYLISLLLFKLLGLKIITFVPDLPSFQYKYTAFTGLFDRLIFPIYLFLTKSLYSVYSYFIFMTKYMIKEFPQRQYSLMEGLVDDFNESLYSSSTKKSIKSVMYAGSLYESMGILNLLNAISLISNKDIKFYFFGRGDMEQTIRDLSQKDSRIVYGGLLPNSQILKFESNVHLLINPRPSSHEYTKFSFPSKLMEYMLSGTPVLTTRLKGIPEEYYDKLYFIDDESPIGIKNAIEHVFSLSDEELKTKSYLAKKYVSEHKNYKVQMERINNEIITKLFKNK